MKQKGISILKLLALTLLPSAVFTAVYAVVGMFWQQLPSMTLFFVIAVLTLFTFEIGVILHANKKEYGKYGFRVAFSRQEKLAWWKVLLYGFVLFSFAGLMMITVMPLENMLMAWLAEKLSAVTPEYFNWENYELMKQYPKGILIFTSVFYIVMNSFICPIIEEIYFRGYLTNRLERYGLAAPMIVTVAFSLYHWWLPFNNIFRICIFGVVAVVAYKKKNIYISMVFHCLCNLFSSISFAAALLE